MSKWTHSICAKCWNKKNPDRQPIKATKGVEEERCCFCGKLASDGIYIREAPQNVMCAGICDSGDSR